jgi:hypothetical protein
LKKNLSLKIEDQACLRVVWEATGLCQLSPIQVLIKYLRVVTLKTAKIDFSLPEINFFSAPFPFVSEGYLFFICPLPVFCFLPAIF